MSAALLMSCSRRDDTRGHETHQTTQDDTSLHSRTASSVRRAQGSQNCGKDGIDPSCVHTEMVGAFDRDELSIGDLVCGALSLIEEVDVIRRHADKAARTPGAK